MKARRYYAEGSLSAAFYDVVTAADVRLRADDELYAALAPAGGSVLELGAGTGRLTAALAARGLKVTGVDIAPTMLVQAKARLAQLSAEIQARIELRHADMTTLDLRRAFDLVVCPFFTLAHVPAGAAWRNTFATAARHLGPGGLAAFHLPRLDLMRRPVAPHPSRPVMDQPLRDGGRLLLFVRERTFNEAVGRLDQVLDYVVADGAGHIVRRSTERLTYWMTAPEPLAADAGLSLDRPPIDVGGAGDIWVFRK